MELVAKVVLQLLGGSVLLIAYAIDYFWHDKRTRRFRRGRVWLVGVGILFLIASVAVVIIDDRRQADALHNLELQLERARQPIRDIDVTFRVDIPTTHQALAEFSNRVQKSLDDSRRLAKLQDKMFVSRSGPAGEPLSLNIPPESPLYPKQERDLLAYYLINYPGLQIDFYAAGNGAINDKRKADLMLAVMAAADESIPMIRGQENADATAAVHIDTQSGFLFVEGANWRVPTKRMRLSGRLQSVPDLLASTVVIRFNGYTFVNDAKIADSLAEVRRDIAVNYLELMSRAGTSGGRLPS